jgi:succinate-semialdehyde dehydrogenase / glutarate-semialdehyde dehydrogenase
MIDASQSLQTQTDCLIDGRWIPAADGQRIQVFDPASKALIATVASAGLVEAAAAVDAAQAAADGWAGLAPRERGEILRRSYELMIEREQFFAELIVTENGKALTDATSEVRYAAEFFRWFSEEAVRNVGSLSTAPSGGNRIMVMHQPVGISVLITPWNFPAAMATRKLAPALAAGCTTILKPASDTPLTALAIGALLEEAGVPAGVVNVLPSSRSSLVVGSIIDDPRVRKLSFTGSTEVGRVLLAQASRTIVNCSMELGGNAPFLVLADADVEAAVEGAMVAKMRNGGEACTAANRFYVHESVVVRFEEGLRSRMAALRVGPGLEDGTDVGPLVNQAAVDKVSELVNDAVAKGAEVTCGGRPGSAPGYFFEPTVLTGVSSDADLIREEIFGPVAPIVPFSDIDEAISMANDTEYGLVSYIYTEDLSVGLHVAERLDAGMVGINRGVVSDPAAPFGGFKQSGLGREGGHEGLLDYLESKYIATSW